MQTKVKIGTHSSEELDVHVVGHDGLAISLLLFAIVIGIVTNEIK